MRAVICLPGHLALRWVLPWACSPNLLASGGADGELCIWNVENPLQVRPWLCCGRLPTAWNACLGRRACVTLLCQCLQLPLPQPLRLLLPPHVSLVPSHVSAIDAPTPQPALYPAMKGGAGAGQQPEITHLSWNRKVQHILGTCTAAGTGACQLLFKPLFTPRLF